MEILGIDIGGSGIKAAIVDINKGEFITDRVRIPTPQPAKPENISEIIDQIVDSFNWQGPVGVSFPTVIKNGKAMHYGNLDKSWKGTQIDNLFEKQTKNNFYVVNDADAAAMAVMKYGTGKGRKGLVIVVTIGTGIGSGVFFNGELLQNFELGRIYGRKGDIMESFASDAARKRKDYSYKDWAKRFNFFLKHVEDTMHPEIFIIGGGISKKLDRFEKYLDVETPVIAAELKNDAGIIGAAYFAYVNINS